MYKENSIPENRYLESGGGDDPYFIEYSQPAFACSFDVAGNTYNEAFYCGLITQMTELPPDTKTTIHTSNEMAVKLVNGDCQVKEHHLIPLVEKVCELLEQRPRVRLAFMPKTKLKANIRAIKAEIAKREAEAAVAPDAFEYIDDIDEDNVCPW